MDYRYSLGFPSENGGSVLEWIVAGSAVVKVQWRGILRFWRSSCAHRVHRRNSRATRSVKKTTMILINLQLQEMIGWGSCVVRLEEGS